MNPWHRFLAWKKQEGINCPEIITLLLTFVIAFIYVLQLFVYRQQAAIMKQQTRAWIGMKESKEESGTAVMKGSFVRIGNVVNVTLQYRMTNQGHSPAQIYIHAEIKDFYKDDPDLAAKAEGECAIARLQFTDRLTVLPDAPTIYAIVYDGKTYDGKTSDKSGTEHMGKIIIPNYDPADINKEHIFSNYGCVVYRSAGDADFHQTPFKAYLSLQGESSINGPFLIGHAD
jgi:hypothetical protein